MHSKHQEMISVFIFLSSQLLSCVFLTKMECFLLFKDVFLTPFSFSTYPYKSLSLENLSQQAPFTEPLPCDRQCTNNFTIFPHLIFTRNLELNTFIICFISEESESLKAQATCLRPQLIDGRDKSQSHLCLSLELVLLITRLYLSILPMALNRI